MDSDRLLKSAVSILILAFLMPAVASAMPPASTSPKALFTSEQGENWIISQPAYRDNIQDRAIRYDESWNEQERLNLTGLEQMEVNDIAESRLGSTAVLTDKNIVLYSSDWDKQRELEISGTPEFLVAKKQSFHLIDKVREGGETNYYLQKVSYDMENFSSKKRIGLDINAKAIEQINQTWITLSPAPEGARITHYSQNWTKERQKDVQLPSRGLESELKGLQASNGTYWVMTSEKTGDFGGKIHEITTKPEYTGNYYEVGLKSVEDTPGVVTTRELPWTPPMLMIAAATMIILGLTVLTALILLVIGPYRTWKKHIKQEEGQGSDTEESDKEED